MGNSILSLKEILRVNFLSLFEEINGVEEVLKKDMANVYLNMDYKTKDLYRNEIKKISEETKISEIYIANKIIEISSTKDEDKKRHIGYYLIDDGKQELLNSLGVKQKKKVSNKIKIKRYVFGIYLITTIASLILGLSFFLNTRRIILSVIVSLILYIPISEIVIQTINYILSKTVKPKIIPKLDLSGGVPKEYSTFIVIPTIIDSNEKIKELFKKLEVYYLANKSKNIFFALLGDCTKSKNEKEKIDNILIKTGIEEAKKLNEKYSNEDDLFPIFHFLYRQRTWNPSEECYLGWERKRGLLCQFNDFLMSGNNTFLTNTIEGNKVPNIKYVITLDSDTNLLLESGISLIGTMAHILNKPILNETKDKVIEGHGILQPRVGINLKSSRKSIFTKIYSGIGGIDSYTNATSDIYQDNFDEGIFTGKGIYDLEVFHTVLYNEIPENKVLSHDLLEGNYLRCGLATDILVMDDYPSKYNAYMKRQGRWIRGDFQISSWLKNRIITKDNKVKKNPLRTTI